MRYCLVVPLFSLKCYQDALGDFQIVHKRWKKTRKRVNRAARSFLLKQLGYVIKHPDFEDKYSGLFAKDGVHLSFIGYDRFMNTLHGSIETFFSNPTCHVYN